MSEENQKYLIPRVEGYGYKPASSEFSLSLVSVNDGRKQILFWSSCREIINSDIMKAFDVVDFEQLRLLIRLPCYNENYTKEKIFNSRQVLRTCEEYAGWEERSVISTVKHSQNLSNCYLITGPKQWMLSPQMLSLAAYLIRMVSFFGPAETQDFGALVEWMKKLHNNDDARRSTHDENTSTDFKSLRQIYTHLGDILKYSEQVFDQEEMWPEDVFEKNRDCFMEYSGIHTFIKHIENKRLYKNNFLEYLEETAIKKMLSLTEETEV